MKYTIPHSIVYEDNEACLKVAWMLRLTPHTKHIGVPYHRFRTLVERLEIHIEPIDTTKQLGDQAIDEGANGRSLSQSLDGLVMVCTRSDPKESCCRSTDFSYERRTTGSFHRIKQAGNNVPLSLRAN
jgi:hypothetical protein